MISSESGKPTFLAGVTTQEALWGLLKTNVRRQLQKAIASTRSELNEKAVALSIVTSGNASVRDTEQVEIVAEDPAIDLYVQAHALISCPFRFSMIFKLSWFSISGYPAFRKACPIAGRLWKHAWASFSRWSQGCSRQCLCGETSAWRCASAPCHATGMIICNINLDVVVVAVVVVVIVAGVAPRPGAIKRLRSVQRHMRSLCKTQDNDAEMLWDALRTRGSRPDRCCLQSKPWGKFFLFDRSIVISSCLHRPSLDESAVSLLMEDTSVCKKWRPDRCCLQSKPSREFFPLTVLLYPVVVCAGLCWMNLPCLCWKAPVHRKS